MSCFSTYGNFCIPTYICRIRSSPRIQAVLFIRFKSLENRRLDVDDFAWSHLGVVGTDSYRRATRHPRPSVVTSMLTSSSFVTTIAIGRAAGLSRSSFSACLSALSLMLAIASAQACTRLCHELSKGQTDALEVGNGMATLEQKFAVPAPSQHELTHLRE